MSADPFRVYFDPEEIGADGYPHVWHGTRKLVWPDGIVEWDALKHHVREQAGHRCERCHHPYPPKITETCPKGEWTPCDEQCTHGTPARIIGGHDVDPGAYTITGNGTGRDVTDGWAIEAQWRILTVHHLNGIKHDLRWWNLAALCQICHLSVQGRVRMEQIYPFEHTEWFKPHAAGYYAWAYLGEELSREETMARLDELLSLERTDG